MNSSLPTVMVFTDAKCINNPGPGGWAYNFQLCGKVIKKSGGIRETTSNRIPMNAAINALKAIDASHRVELYSDSDYLCKGINEWMHGWQRNGWNKSSNAQKLILNFELWSELWRQSRRHQVIAMRTKHGCCYPGYIWCEKQADVSARKMAKKIGVPVKR